MNTNLFDEIVQGLQESIAYSKGKLSLRTTAIPAPPPELPPRRILALREQCRMSQAVFAATLNVSPRTVQAWEQGKRVPSHASARLLQLIETQPGIVRLITDGKLPPSPAHPDAGA